MTERAHLRAAEREVRVIFEPNRTAAKCLLLAYARVVPIRWRVLQGSCDPVPAESTTRSVEAGRA
jgi:hypothetical protein